MNRNWLLVLLAGFLEIFWVAGLNYSTALWQWILTIVAIGISFTFVILATRELPIGTVYAVFAGIGTAGTVIVEILFFGEPFSALKILLIGTLLTGVISLKLLSDDQEKKSEVIKEAT
ncbi:quaternary ammonium compound-resistance protein SugE [Geomicrobium sp. JCM 19037]|uniref:DMT family transporter n=1 Tax=Geomicrobium sp. JCM 19037 TaxID=1460634 RepID=UPI00045F3343|nr:multidrug efflux SMR transporter [Geomicrobium sp. JCM 19037]GAK05425.1 quaternary ammonium compound-resistance protein SugE [Geomicrobium sp. JCM 19037]